MAKDSLTHAGKEKVNANGWPILKDGKQKQTEAQRAALYVNRQIAALKSGRPVMSLTPMTPLRNR